MKVLMYNQGMPEDTEPEDWYNAEPPDDKLYFEPDEPIIHIDPETSEEYIINPAGTKLYLNS